MAERSSEEKAATASPDAKVPPGKDDSSGEQVQNGACVSLLRRVIKEELEGWEKQKKRRLNEVCRGGQRIHLNVGGYLFVTSLRTLCRFPDSKLGAMFSKGVNELQLDEDGCFFIDRDGTYFRHILNYLRDPGHFSVELTQSEMRELEREISYYGLADAMLPKPVIEQKPSAKESFSDELSGKAYPVFISQSRSGMWQFSCPNTAQVEVSAIICRKCCVAYITSHGQNVGFRRFIHGNRKIIDSTQPEPKQKGCPFCVR